MYHSPSTASSTNPNPTTATTAASLGKTMSAAPFFAPPVAATAFVYVSVTGGTVVPGIVLAGCVVATTTVLPPTLVVTVTVCAGTVDGDTVVPGIVVVYVASPPSWLAGMAVPTPALV